MGSFNDSQIMHRGRAGETPAPPSDSWKVNFAEPMNSNNLAFCPELVMLQPVAAIRTQVTYGPQSSSG
ncbi:MAG TPA: hypothetical protein VME24_00045 [Alphaproteobacteria bacterium]|nr:hypothetical protein [Alphaproteobacteria bacterium]